jgi:hypothetical protein
MKSEYDFNKGERGKYFRPDAEFSFPMETMEMTTALITTLTKMMETLPESAQDLVVEHMRDYIANLQDELHWDALYKETTPNLVEAARKAKREKLVFLRRIR